MTANRSLLTIAAALAGAALAAAGEPSDSPRQQLFGGYSSLRLEGENLPGASLAFSRPLAGALRLRAEAALQLGSVAGEDVTELSFLVGPGLALPRLGRVRPFVHAGLGLVRVRRQVDVFGVAIGPEGVCSGGCPWQNALAADAGGGLDIRLTDRLALRLPQVDYRFTHRSDANENRLRAAAGLVWNWGR